jgi:hypothetical protein
MTDIDLKTISPDTSLPTTGFLFGADSQASTNPSVYSTQTVATTLLGSTSLTGDTLTVASAPVLNLTQTWNNGAVTFTGVKFNATSTASATASLLMDFQVGSVSQFNIRKDGFFKTLGGLEAGGSGVGNIAIANDVSGFFIGTSFDTVLTRKGAANFRLGTADAASPVAQTLSVQSVVAGQTNASAAAYPFTITGAQGTGSGVGGSIVFQVAPAGGSGTAQNALVAALTIDTTNAVFNRGGGSSVRSEGEGFYALSSGNNKINVSQYGLRLTSDLALTWSNSTTNCASVIDTYLLRDTANTLAQRNGTAAQTFRAYNTYTDASNYERGVFDWTTTANTLTIGTEKAGTGTVRNLQFVSAGGAFNFSGTSNANSNIFVTGGLSVTTSVYIGQLLQWGAASAVSGNVGLDGRSNKMVVFFDAAASSTGAGAELIEMTAPSAPSANRVRFYAEDNGSGKTRLMALFATGAAQQVAIEP